MAKIPDRRKQQNKVGHDRRQNQRRKNTKISESTPVRRNEDWDKIDSELNN